MNPKSVPTGQAAGGGAGNWSQFICVLLSLQKGACGGAGGGGGGGPFSKPLLTLFCSFASSSAESGTRDRELSLSLTLPLNSVLRKVCVKVHDADFLSEKSVWKKPFVFFFFPVALVLAAHFPKLAGDEGLIFQPREQPSRQPRQLTIALQGPARGHRNN